MATANISWSEQKLGVGGGSSDGPSLCGYRDHLYAVWKGAGDDQRMFWSSYDGNVWSPQQEGVGGGTSNQPGLAVFQDRLYAAWKGANADDRMFWSSFDGKTWSCQQLGIGGGSNRSPAIAAFQDRLFAVWKGAGDDQRMFLSSYDGRVWSPQQVSVGVTNEQPSLAVFQGRLYAAWKGVAGDDHMFWSSFDGNAWSDQQMGIGGGSHTGPMLTTAIVGQTGSTRLFAAWRGAGDDQRMFCSMFDGKLWTEQQTGIGGGTSSKPTLAAIQNKLFAGWRGANADEHMFWSSADLKNNSLFVGEDSIRFDSGQLSSALALGGSTQLIVNVGGDYLFTTHAHDSGFDNIDYAIAAVLVSTSGVAFTFEHKGHVEGTSAGLPFGSPVRDSDYNFTGTDPRIAAEYDRIANGGIFMAKLTGVDKLQQAITEILASAATQLAAAGIKALIAIV